MMQLGPVAISLIVVAAVVVLGIVVFAVRALTAGRRRGRRPPANEFHGGGRIAVLETREIDERRKLVLVRCDDVEHLIVTGGPTDLLVENDVRKTRPQTGTTQTGTTQAGATRMHAPGPLQPTASPAVSTGPARVPAAMGASLDAAIAAVVPKAQTETPRPRAGEPRPPLQARPTSAPMAPRPAARNGEAPASMPRVAPAELPRRDTGSSRRATPQAQLPARANDASRPQGGDRSPRAERDSSANGLPAAQVPWPETDSIEEEIVQALRFDAPRGDVPAARREPTPSPVKPPPVESSATLGDLADRLEEALAREIGATAPAPRRSEPASPETPKSTEADRGKRSTAREGRERQEKRESRSESRQGTTTPAPAPAAESAPRETPQPERREEAPVISLNARRREAADPLEDEMARLLGELTGDTKGR